MNSLKEKEDIMNKTDSNVFFFAFALNFTIKTLYNIHILVKLLAFFFKKRGINVTAPMMR